ncbi:hypothetical protein [Saccharothrix saharensis]|uniref:hypothetical protein n=1 Tax=Saccharothrix saharensis TaxID=571190 RepID=UPI001B86A01B|nr:hypothetical protein [Saccharothrix saharensis]
MTVVEPTPGAPADLVRSYLTARGRQRPLLPVRMPGKAGRAYRAGENPSGAGAAKGTRAWVDFPADRVVAPP